ncbi:MAG TPA: transcriptional regulator MntR [Pseudogracilibacillus sp.]|nr:transcriptional regulator MntR [Pseudogracilibacillus sp.]
MPKPTPSMEDYIELVFNLIQTKGYARVTDLAETLEVHPSSVTKMIQKLDRDGYVHYEKYRGFVLTDKGTKVGKRLLFRHELLEDFLGIIGVEEDRIYEDVEGIEHHLSWNAIDRIADLVQYFNNDPERFKNLAAIIEASKETESSM